MQPSTVPLTYIDRDDHNIITGAFSPQPLSDITYGILEPINPSPVIEKILHFADLLLLSNHITLAHSLINTVYKHASNAITPRFQRDNPLPYRATLALDCFWLAHPTLSRPENCPKLLSTEQEIANAQWGNYREWTGTAGWMLERCDLQEPEDPHLWKETDDPRMLATCCRLLGRVKREGVYPPLENLREALEAGRKLYAQPQIPITEVKCKGKQDWRMERHSYLLYRRLVIELAIRVGELETAREVMSLGLRLDGFNWDGGEMGHYLSVPGIYDVLAMLAEGGKESNPFFIEEDDAEEMVRELERALELRATKGRQWSLAPEKVGWKELLDRLAKGAWKVNRAEYRRNGIKCVKQVLNPPATEEEIEAAEKKVGELPADFKEMIRIADGFNGGWHFLSGGIASINAIEIPGQPVDGYEWEFCDDGFKQDGNISGDIIEHQPATECDGYLHYIIPPKTWKDNVVGREVPDGEYRYWNEAVWEGGGIDTYDSVRDWVASQVEEVEGMVKRGEKVEFDGEDEGSDSDFEDGAATPSTEGESDGDQRGED